MVFVQFATCDANNKAREMSRASVEEAEEEEEDVSGEIATIPKFQNSAKPEPFFADVTTDKLVPYA